VKICSINPHGYSSQLFVTYLSLSELDKGKGQAYWTSRCAAVMGAKISDTVSYTAPNGEEIKVEIKEFKPCLVAYAT